MKEKAKIDDLGDVLSQKEVCSLLDISRNTLTKLMEQKQIKYFKCATQYKYLKSDVLALFGFGGTDANAAA